MYLRAPLHEYMLTKSPGRTCYSEVTLQCAARPSFCSILEYEQSRVDLISLLSTCGAHASVGWGSLLTLCERAANLEPMPARKPTSAKLRIVHAAESSETPLSYFSIPVEVSEEYGVIEWPGLEQTGKGEGL